MNTMNNKVAICVLSRGYFFKKKYNQLIERNNAVYEQIILKSKADIDFLIFHEGNISESDQKYINKHSPQCSIQYISIKDFFKKKTNLTTSTYCHETTLSKNFSNGYKCMCHFWFSEFLKHTNDYKYVVRIDEDCIVSDFPLDSLLSEMTLNGIKYISPQIFGYDSPDVVIGLEKLILELTSEHKISKTPAFDQNPYTNVFLIDASYFRNNDVFSSFARKVSDSGCIYINRWGDLPLWGCFLSVMDEKIFAIRDEIKYFHGSHKVKINEG